MGPSSNNHTDTPPPSHGTTTAGYSRRPNSGPARARLVDEKLPRQSVSPTTPRSSSDIPSNARTGASRPVSQVWSLSSWLSSVLSFISSRASEQARQTVLALIRNLVLNVETPDLQTLNNCADECQAHGLDLSALLQEPYIKRHSAVYWSVLDRRDTLLPLLLAHAAPLSQPTVSEIRLACLASSNQDLFQSLRCQREPFTKQMILPSTNPDTDALVLGSMPADEVSIREIDGQGAFMAEMQINHWQKRMQVSGHVSVEFIDRGRMWSLTFFSSPPWMAAGKWQVALCLLEHSPPTFIDSKLVIDVPSSPPNESQTSESVSLSPLLDDPSSPAALAPQPRLPSLSNTSKSKSKTARPIEVCLKSTHPLMPPPPPVPDPLSDALEAMYAIQKEWSPPDARVRRDYGGPYTNAIAASLDGAGAELLYADTPFIANDGTLHVRLEASRVCDWRPTQESQVWHA